jgi:signal peptidase II
VNAGADAPSDDAASSRSSRPNDASSGSSTPDAADDTAPARARAVRVGIAILALVAIDQLTKSWAVHALASGPKSIIGDTVQLALTRNSGAAFSRFRGLTPVLAVLAIIVTIVLGRSVRRATDRWTVVALSLVLAGALGNLSDRIFRSPGFLRGEVVDYVKVGWWPVFNVADSCITIGAVLLIARGVLDVRHDATRSHA